LPAVIKHGGQVGGVIGIKGDGGAGLERPDDTVGGSIGRNARHAASRIGSSVSGRRRGGRRRRILPVGEREGFQGHARHTPVNEVGHPVAVDGGGGVALAPDGRHSLDIRVRVAFAAEFTHASRVRVHHVNIPRLVSADHQVGVGGGAPGRGQKALARRTDILVIGVG